MAFHFIVMRFGRQYLPENNIHSVIILSLLQFNLYVLTEASGTARNKGSGGSVDRGEYSALAHSERFDLTQTSSI